ncbi:LOW QUALITY PROTEIN: pre-mRNA 3'-end-processing factor FIP1-like [Dermacentor silvarum]|uniref:LOW QUALITY PROTEIN: pre-mRNA 3'-end-processing factor FIP1-like n=1 Tax=Dermacentor silvarum TaxID=543639 RepID=UPI002101C0D4|nr:LOW QUALITY PROTEIN: pre-mRNA 3'-end-processing factor FIP1-like [Dermacentor silvarum]
MASAAEDDDAWLYGDNDKTDAGATNERSSDSKLQVDESALLQNKDESQQDDREAGELSCEDEQGQQSEGPATDPVEVDGEAKGPSAEADKNGDAGDGADEDEDDDDDDDDDVQVTIRDIKAPPYSTYPGPTQTVNLNIKRGPPFTSNLGPGSGVPGVGKTKGLDVDEVALINGTSIYEFNIESLEDKPWRKPGADITDYFNYGFNEDTWKIYCDRQRKLRSDNNVPIKEWRTGRNEVPQAHVFLGDAPLAWQQQRQQQQGPLPPEPLLPQVPIPPVNENSKYTGVVIGVPPPLLGSKKAGPPPGRKMSGSIDVIGGGAPSLPSRRPGAAKEGVIQVIGAGEQPLGGITLPPTHMPPPGLHGHGPRWAQRAPAHPRHDPRCPTTRLRDRRLPTTTVHAPAPPLPGSASGGGPSGDRGSSYGEDGRSSYYNGASGYGQSYGDDGGGSGGGGSWSGRERSERGHGSERGDRSDRERERDRERPSSRREYDDEERRESRRYREYYRERERERDRDRERDRRERGGGIEDEYEETSSSSRYERRHREHRGDKEERERHRSSRRRHHRGGDDEEEEERRSSKHKHKRSKKERPPVEEAEAPSGEAGGASEAAGDDSKAD